MQGQPNRPDREDLAIQKPESIWASSLLFSVSGLDVSSLCPVRRDLTGCLLPIARPLLHAFFRRNEGDGPPRAAFAITCVRNPIVTALLWSFQRDSNVRGSMPLLIPRLWLAVWVLYLCPNSHPSRVSQRWLSLCEDPGPNDRAPVGVQP